MIITKSGGNMSIEMMIVFGLIAVIAVGYAIKSGSAGANSDDGSGSKSTTFVPPREKTDDELIADYHKLMGELPSALKKSSDITPSKSDMSSLQRLSRLIDQPAVKSLIDRAAVLELLELGIACVGDVYRSDEKTGTTRLKAYTKAARKLRPLEATSSVTQTVKAEASPRAADGSNSAPKPKASKKSEKTAKVPVPQFDLPFDVLAFASAFPQGWRLLNEVHGDNIIMEGPNGATIGAAQHQLAPSQSLRDALEVLVEDLDDSSEIEEFTTAISAKGWTVEGQHDDSNVYVVELYGPALMSVRFVYQGNNLDRKVQKALLKAASDLIWLNASVELVSDLNVRNLKELRRQISAILKKDKELRDEILGSYEDDESIYLLLSELEAIAIEGPPAYPTVRAMIRYALDRAEIDADDLNTLRLWCDPHFLNDPVLKEEIASKVISSASSTQDYLALAEFAAETGDTDQASEYIQSAYNALEATEDYLDFLSHEMISLDKKSTKVLCDKAITAAKDVGDLRRIMSSDAATADLLKPIMKRMRASTEDEVFFDTHWNPLEVLQSAFNRGFVDQASVETELMTLLKASPVLGDAVAKTEQRDEKLIAELPSGISLADLEINRGPRADKMHLLSMAETAFGEEWEKLGENLLARAIKAAVTSGQKLAAYIFLRDTLQDEGRANAYLKSNRKFLQPLLDQLEAEEKQEQLIDAICRCALLVAVGDGSISEEESEEVGKIRGIVEMMYQNREAVAILENTHDIEQAREARTSTALHYNMALMLFGQPSYTHEVYDALSDVSSKKELDGIFRTYAERITDPFAQRLAAWAGNEVASIDGLDNGEKHALSVMAGVWGLNLADNQRYFRDFVYPATSDEIEFTGPTEGNGLDRAREIDVELAELGDDAASTLARTLGVDSIEALMRLLGEKEEEEAVVNTEDLPPIFEAILSHGDWDEVLALVAAGADVNETINLNGIKGISILMLACEHATVDVVKPLVEAGANVDLEIGNPKRASGYNTPLTASLKNGGRMDIFQYLLQAGANPDPFDDRASGWTPLTIAAQNQNHKALKMLIERGADVNIATSNGANAFKLIASVETSDARKCLELLVKAGIDTTRTDDEGFAGIHNAVCECSVKHARYLVEKAKVPVNLPMKVIPGTQFFTPLQKALSFGNTPVVEYLLEAGADPSVRGSGRSVFSAIGLGAVEGDVADPLAELDRFLPLGLSPDLEDVIRILGFISDADVDDDDADRLAPFFEKLIISSKFKLTELNELDPEDIDEKIGDALDTAPELASLYLGFLKKRGCDLEALATSAAE